MRLGFVGLGTMGGRIAYRLLEAGYEVTGYNRTKSRADPLIEAGLRWAETPRTVAQESDVVFSMVTDTRALMAVTEGRDGILAGLGPGKVYVDMSTVSPPVSRDMARRVEGLGARMAEAPVSGSVSTLEEGKLALMVGSDDQTFEQLGPILRDIGPTVIHVGTNGQAVLMKIATNLNLAVQMLAFSEALLLAEKGGIPRERAVEVLLSSVIASPMLLYRGPFVVDMPDEAWFDVNMMQKDLLLALEAGRGSDVPMPTTAVTNEMLTAARGMGFAFEDFAAVFHALAGMSGLRAPSASIEAPQGDPG